MELLTRSLRISRKHSLGEGIPVVFGLKNNSGSDLRVLKWNTPLDDTFLNSFNVFHVTKNSDGDTVRNRVAYDGIIVKRGEPSEQDYVTIPAGETLSKRVDLADHYDIHEEGIYEMQMGVNVHDHFKANAKNAPAMRKTSDHQAHKLSRRKVSFKVTAGAAPRPTLGAQHRTLEALSGPIVHAKTTMLAKAGGPPQAAAPKIVGGTAEEKAMMIQVHNAASIYLWGCVQALNATQSAKNSAYVLWFGAYNTTRFGTVKTNYQSMLNVMGSEQITYDLTKSGCQSGWYAYTYKGARTVYMCSGYFNAPFAGKDSKVGTTIHELSHAVCSTDDNEYSRSACKALAKSDPAKAINNADSYEYFAETNLPMNYQFDSANQMPDGKTYVTLGNIFIRYSDSYGTTIDDGYPLPLLGNWGGLPTAFATGFDSMSTLPNGKTYVTKGTQYIRYSGKSPSSIDSGYPSNLQGAWGNLPTSFSQGFDSMSTLPNGKTYVTKGTQYIRYSDKSASSVDSGYPQPIAGRWGNTPANFNTGFDAIVVFPNKKTYVTKGGQYIRYSDKSASTVDSGYPRAIAGPWGTPPNN